MEHLSLGGAPLHFMGESMIKQQIEKWIIRMTRSMNLRSKIVLFYGLIVFLPTVLLAAGAGYMMLHTVRANYMLTIRKPFGKVRRVLNSGSKAMICWLPERLRMVS